MALADKQSNPVDIHVGGRVRMRRKFLGMSQEALADAIALTFQQVQKYERGTNRISSSKLYDISKALQAPIAYFFEDYDDGAVLETFSESESENTPMRSYLPLKASNWLRHSRVSPHPASAVKYSIWCGPCPGQTNEFSGTGASALPAIISQWWVCLCFSI